MDHSSAQQPKLYAFISYSHKDVKVAKWLQKNLEAFRLPSQIYNEIDARSRYLRPILLDQTDFNTGILTDVIRQHLEESKFLIIICSKRSAHSEWVSKEAEAFVKMGRLNRIIPVFIDEDGIPERELFPIFLREYFKTVPGSELLGIHFSKTSREQCLIRIVSKMLGISYDSLWNRHRRQSVRRIRRLSCAGVVAALVTYILAVPIRLEVEMETESASLPTSEKLSLAVNGTKLDKPLANNTIKDITLPGYRRFSNIKLHADALYFQPVDTILAGNFGWKHKVKICLKRDNTFAVYSGLVLTDNMTPIKDVSVKVLHLTTKTDVNGKFYIKVPLEHQRLQLPIKLEREGFQSIVRSDEIPSTNIRYVMFKR